MLPNEQPFNGYKDGAEMWHANVLKHGIAEATTICSNYLDLNLRRKRPDEEMELCREMFRAMCEATAGRVLFNKIVYPFNFTKANERMETTYFNQSKELNRRCARSIDRIIADSCYKPDSYNLELAAMCAIHDYGFPRICSVLAFNYQSKINEPRFSKRNCEWTNCFTVHEEAFHDAWLQAHAILIDGFCTYVRRLHQLIDGERVSLPGKEERGEFVGNVEIKQSIITSGDNPFQTGYAIGHNPNAVEPWVCWQFAVRDGTRHFNWGEYGDNLQSAIDSYNARVFVALSKAA